MANLSDIKFVSVTRPHLLDPISTKRRKLMERIDEQLAALDAYQRGEVFTRTVHHTERDLETDEPVARVSTRRVVPWWWTDKDGKVYVSVRYGTKILEFTKGKSAIQVDGLDQIPPVLTKLRAAVAAGELDTLLAQAGEQLRKRFKAD
ncbi:MAG: hypothetical protein RL014_1015 [Pseudomonadota bacterium]|jgi:hypothetical protein